MARVVLCDDHEMMMEGQKAILEGLGHDVIGLCWNGLEVVKFIESQPVDLAILDHHMPLKNGLEAIVDIRNLSPDTRIIVMSVDQDPDRVMRAFYNGASGYLDKSVDVQEFTEAVQSVLSGKPYVNKALAPEVVQNCAREQRSFIGVRQLTTREREVVKLYGEGKKDKEISELLNIAVSTVRFHHNRICQDFNLKNHADIVKFALKEGLTSL